MENNVKFSSEIFLKGIIPLLKVIANDTPKFAKKFEHLSCVYQISALNHESEEGKIGTHLMIDHGEWKVFAGKVTENPMIDLQFRSVEAFVSFFKGTISLGTLPKIRGIAKNFCAFSRFLQVLLKMNSLLGVKTAPSDESTKILLVKSFFYLLSSGISALNKCGHPEIHDWASKSPDRVYSWAVNDHPEVAAYIRVKAGKSRAGRGEYRRALPFFTLRFDSLDSALGTLLGTEDMMESTKSGKLIMDGAPEFGAQLGSFMLTVSGFAK